MSPLRSAQKELEVFAYEDQKILARFSFISDQVISQNIFLYAQHMLMLHSLGKEYALSPQQQYMNNKIIIILASQVAEAIMHFIVREGIDNGTFKGDCLDYRSVTLPGDKEILLGTPLKEFISASDTIGTIKVVMKLEQRVPNEFTSNIPFNELIRALRRGSLSSKLVSACQSLQQKRNKIHIGGMEAVDDVYPASYVDDTFEELNTVIEEAGEITKQFHSKP